MKTKIKLQLLMLSFLAMLASIPANGQGTAFTYQGRFNSGSGAANGNFDFTFTLFATNTDGVALAGPVTITNTGVTNGLFTVPIDFGPGAFIGGSNWVEIAVRTNGDADFTTLAPRQQVSPSPYAITAESVVAGGITAPMLAAGSVTSDKIAVGAVKGNEIDDGGTAAYQGFQQAVQPFGGDTSLSFSNLYPVVATNGTAPAFSLTINGTSLGTVIGFTGYEGISVPYSFSIEVQAPGNAVSPGSEIGLTGQLTLTRNGRSTVFAGTVTSCTLAGSSGKGLLYVVQLESPLANLAHTTDFKIFQSLPTTNVAILVYTSSSGATLADSLTGSYAPHVSFTQFGETSLNFFSRILENEGIFYFFNQGASPPMLTLGDSASAYLASGNSYNYYGNTATNIPAGLEFIRAFQRAAHQSTLTSTINSYDFTQPGASLPRSSNATGGVGEYFEFGNNVNSAAYNLQLANARQGVDSEERALIAGAATAPDLRPGYTFGVTDLTGVGSAGTYLVTSIHHAGFIRVTNGVSSYFYGHAFEAIPASMNYRPPLVTPRPNAQPCVAVVTGPSGTTDQSYTDAYGRAKVSFKWDRHGSTDETSSEWVRIASPMASGNGRGMIFLPRVGDEVLVSFIQGDPDQPIILGSLYNASNMPPYPLPANKSRSTIRSTGTPGQDAQINEMRFEDKAGAEELYFSAAKDLNTVVANNETTTVTGNYSVVASNIVIQATHQVTINGSLTATTQTIGTESITDGIVVDQAALNPGNVYSNALTFGSGSGEGICSQRTAGNNQYDLLLFTDFTPRITILNSGFVGVGNNSPTSLFEVGTATCNGTTWQNSSDRAVKEGFCTIDPCEVLEKVSTLPITEWSYKTETNGMRHMGPVAQDFHAAFGLNGTDDKHISTVDEGGVALAAIQGLNQKVDSQNAALEMENVKLKAQNQALEQRLERLEKLLQTEED